MTDHNCNSEHMVDPTLRTQGLRTHEPIVRSSVCLSCTGELGVTGAISVFFCQWPNLTESTILKKGRRKCHLAFFSSCFFRRSTSRKSFIAISFEVLIKVLGEGPEFSVDI